MKQDYHLSCLLPKAFWAANIAEFYDAGDFSTPANFERRLATSSVGIDTSSLAHAKYESGGLKIRNIAIANTNKWDSKSQNLTVFQRQFLLHTHKKKSFVQKNNLRSTTTWTIKSQPYW